MKAIILPLAAVLLFSGCSVVKDEDYEQFCEIEYERGVIDGNFDWEQEFLSEESFNKRNQKDLEEELQKEREKKEQCKGIGIELEKTIRERLEKQDYNYHFSYYNWQESMNRCVLYMEYSDGGSNRRKEIYDSTGGNAIYTMTVDKNGIFLENMSNVISKEYFDNTFQNWFF